MTIALSQRWATTAPAATPVTPAMTEQQLITGCKANDRKAQRLVYDRYSPVMLAVARRYTARDADAEDVLVSAFFKVFDKISSFAENGSFEGWIRRIVVNEALMLLRKKHALKKAADIGDVNPTSFAVPAEATTRLAEGDIMKLLDEMPVGYRTVFNLYVVEGYKHREIAELMGISINTSKSQLILAKKRMRELLLALGYER